MRAVVRKPKIYPQGERSFHCGACSVASVLDYFGVEPEPIPTLYRQLRAEYYPPKGDGLHSTHLAGYFLRRDWVAIIGETGGPHELKADEKDGTEYRAWHGLHDLNEQRVATWRCVKAMLASGFLAIMEFQTNARTQHFAVVYDAFIRKDIHWLRLACSSQGYMEMQVLSFLTHETGGTRYVFVRPDNLELR